VRELAHGQSRALRHVPLARGDGPLRGLLVFIVAERGKALKRPLSTWHTFPMSMETESDGATLRRTISLLVIEDSIRPLHNMRDPK
jgi:hypothetical protein